MGQVTFGGPIFNVVSLKCIGKRQKKTFTKSLGGGSWPPCPPGCATGYIIKKIWIWNGAVPQICLGRTWGECGLGRCVLLPCDSRG